MKMLEIHGAGFENKGAELMLRTAVHELRSRLSNIHIVIDPSYGPYEKRCQLNLWQTFPYRLHVGSGRFRRQFRWQKLLKNVPSRILNRYGCVPLSSIEAFIDISGFAYSDQWGIRATENLASLTDYFHRNNRPIILLPQAFGPFEKPQNQAAFTQVVQNANMIFARDRQSYEFVRKLAPEANNLHQAPDITLFYPHYNNYKIKGKQASYVSIVPNTRMLEQGQKQWGDQYVAYLVNAIQLIQESDILVRLIVHDTMGPDQQLAELIYEQVRGERIEIVTEEDPLRLKQIIGQSLLLIGSRFHSIVAALAQGVPTICLGWAHKYEMLMEDFKCGELLISTDITQSEYEKLVRRLIETSVNSRYRERIGKQLDRFAVENEKMWQNVVNTLRGEFKIR